MGSFWQYTKEPEEEGQSRTEMDTIKSETDVAIDVESIQPISDIGQSGNVELESNVPTELEATTSGQPFQSASFEARQSLWRPNYPDGMPGIVLNESQLYQVGSLAI